MGARRGPLIFITLSFLWVLLLQIHLHSILSHSNNNFDSGVSFSPVRHLRMAQQNEADASFNNVPITHVPPSTAAGFHSTAHCIGLTFSEESWVYRSCKYQNLCYDISQSVFVLFQSTRSKMINDILTQSGDREQLFTLSSALDTTVSIGGINEKWSKKDQALLEWSPVIHDYNEQNLLREGYYALPEDIVLVPFHRYVVTFLCNDIIVN